MQSRKKILSNPLLFIDKYVNIRYKGKIFQGEFPCPAKKKEMK